MSVSELKRRRTFAVISHPDAGKTTLTEKLLLFSGAIQIAGTVKGRKSNRYATSDWMEIEKQRGISVASSVMQFEYGDAVINLLDTPGHEDFSEDTYRVLTAVDAAVMVIDGANGVEAQTLKLLEVCRSRKTPIVTFINKLDREVREPLELLDEIEQHLGVAAVPFTWPIGMGKDFQGVYDIQRDQVRIFRAGQDKAGGEVETLQAPSDEEGERRFGHAWIKAKEENIVGRDVWALFMSTEDGAASSQNIAGFFNRGVSYEVERRVKTVHGERLFLFRNKFVQSGSGIDEQFLICSGTDITEERLAQERLTQLANTDSLTGLANRNAIQDKIRAAIEDAAPGEAVGVLFLDLDNFKKVNDHYGHVFGDRLIRDVSSAISECLNEGDTLARLGGDEFIVLAAKGTAHELETTAQRILERMRTPFALGLVEVYTGCSIGIARYPEHGDSLESLIRSADTAMYVAKDEGKRTHRVFSPEMNRRVAEYMWLDTNLRRGLEEGQLTLHYQPKLSLATGVVQGVEALVRWNSPERGQIMPSEFIRYAEESGLIGVLGRWVMETAAKQAAKWKADGYNLRIAINVSARQLVDTAVVRHFSEALQNARLDPCLIDLELTESCLIEDETAAIDLIRQFRQLGAQVHLDDFGTGYSSLSQLGRIPLDVIKLDRSFVRSINADTKAQALVRSMVAVAQELNFKVVAEGIETESEEVFMKGLGVDYVQGFLYGQAMPAAEFERWLQDRQKLRLIA